MATVKHTLTSRESIANHMADAISQNSVKEQTKRDAQPNDPRVLAPFACHPHDSRGRLFPETPCPMRDPLQRDRDRIIHAAAFRRLQHKTQVFVTGENEYFRSRLTHTLEVAQIARALARGLSLNEDLAEAVALAHDLGHPPFGHAGEDALTEVLEPHLVFNHNDQTFRLLTVLEKKYSAFDGLNLTWETLEGVVKHNGPIMGSYLDHPGLMTIFEHDKAQSLELTIYASAEAQIAALSDDIAYNTHDIDDGLRAGLFTLNDLRKLSVTGEVILELERKFPQLDPQLRANELISGLINRFVRDVFQTTHDRLKSWPIKTADDVRNLKEPVVIMSPTMHEKLMELRAFLYERMYFQSDVMAMKARGKTIIKDLFAHQLSEIPNPPTREVLRVLTDRIANLTDTEATAWHHKLSHPSH